MGALPGGRPVPGMDFGNSPAEIVGRDLSGITLIQFTAGGVKGLVDCDHATEVLAGSLVCARSTARYIRTLAPSTVTLVITGLWTDRDGDEDHACADLIEAYLRGSISGSGRVRGTRAPVGLWPPFRPQHPPAPARRRS